MNNALEISSSRRTQHVENRVGNKKLVDELLSETNQNDKEDDEDEELSKIESTATDPQHTSLSKIDQQKKGGSQLDLKPMSSLTPRSLNLSDTNNNNNKPPPVLARSSHSSSRKSDASQVVEDLSDLVTEVDDEN